MHVQLAAECKVLEEFFPLHCTLKSALSVVVSQNAVSERAPVVTSNVLVIV